MRPDEAIRRGLRAWEKVMERGWSAVTEATLADELAVSTRTARRESARALRRGRLAHEPDEVERVLFEQLRRFEVTIRGPSERGATATPCGAYGCSGCWLGSGQRFDPGAPSSRPAFRSPGVESCCFASQARGLAAHGEKRRFAGRVDRVAGPGALPFGGQARQREEQPDSTRRRRKRGRLDSAAAGEAFRRGGPRAPEIPRAAQVGARLRALPTQNEPRRVPAETMATPCGFCTAGPKDGEPTAADYDDLPRGDPEADDPAGGVDRGARPPLEAVRRGQATANAGLTIASVSVAAYTLGRALESDELYIVGSVGLVVGPPIVARGSLRACHELRRMGADISPIGGGMAWGFWGGALVVSVAMWADPAADQVAGALASDLLLVSSLVSGSLQTAANASQLRERSANLDRRHAESPAVALYFSGHGLTLAGQS